MITSSKLEKTEKGLSREWIFRL